ncbi:FKBP-type peptidyl-prolyl cis-trans isomerase [Mucilaginibacter segetis]|uniref:Peptidyl-prolyl cis-trans isomerase n=1 Tax=Mucilaginibacter segetis TaxID=2793071 RepID=A0A934PW28_9SPHI|nr:FKBP-type peptidyl-prolyl cis-trans isomerase [Mucilaginibacter segetis]MBK0380141.1 FKBP-type peptidyl-prolyl cis-trans isomerase [Mucilaginibacter segetis]
MKKYIILLTIAIVGLASCKKEKTVSASEQAVIDDTAIQTYLAANPDIDATKDASGLYYQVITEGSGANPTVSSTVTVNYTGKVLNGNVFAEPSNLTSPLSGLIKGWQIGIPHIKTGGRILLIVPSGLAYGATSPGAAIPANAVLVFTIDLLSFN